MKFELSRPWPVLALVIAWRLVLLLLTAQPVPGNDAFFFDGGVVNWLLHGHYVNASLAQCFPISGHEVYAAYPPVYQALLWPWMAIFGTSALSAMWFHFCCFCVSALLLARILANVLPNWPWSGLPLLFLLAVTFDDRPEGLAHVFGLAAILAWSADMRKTLSRPWAEAGMVLALFLSLYTSLVVGGLYCGIVVLSGFAGWFMARHPLPWRPILGVLGVFAGVTFWIFQAHPLWWRGFVENVRQTPVATAGFRLPDAAEVLKIIRNAPVFLLGLVCLPSFFRGKAEETVWRSLCAGVLITGTLLLAGTLTLFTANYVSYLWYSQVLLAAGLLAFSARLQPGQCAFLRTALACSLLLISVRAVGMSTWGVLCAKDVSYGRAKTILHAELGPFVASGKPVVISSAFLYEATRLGVQRAVHSDWAYDRRQKLPGGELGQLKALHPSKLVLTQFDYYRVYAPLLAELERHPELGSARVRNTAAVRSPDSIPSIQRVLQHVSWAPVIVELAWADR